MRARVCASVAVLLCVYLFPARIAPAANGPATVTYFDRATQIVLQLALPKIPGHFDAVTRSGPVKLTYRVRASGALESVRVTSGNPNSFVAQTFVNAIRSAKFPPIPKAVLKEQGKNWIDIDATFGALNNIRR
jgi:TonB family protein